MAKQGRYSQNQPKLKPGDADVFAFPSEDLEICNMKWEAEMLDVFGFTKSELDCFKAIRSRIQFLDHCKEKGIHLSMF